MSPALLFDLDGTLLKSDPLHVAVFIDLFAERGREIDEAFYMREIHGRHNLDIFAELFPDADPQEMSDAKEAALRERLGTEAEPMPGLVDLLDRADAMGWPRAVATNAPRDNAEAMLSAIGLRDRFEVLIIGDECERGKPDPAPYRAAMAALGVDAAQSIAFEDSPSGVKAAQAAGALTIGLRSSLDDAALRRAGADASIADFADPTLPGLIARRDTTQGARTA